MEVFSRIGNWFVRVFKPLNDWFYESTAGIRDFVINNSRNPFFWVGIILIGLVVFELVYRALNRK